MTCPSCGTGIRLPRHISLHAVKQKEQFNKYSHHCPVCNARLTIETQLKTTVKGVRLYEPKREEVG